MTFPELEATLITVTEKVHRTFATDEPPYIVWDDDGEAGSLYGDGKMKNQIIEGTIDLFTKDEEEPMFDQIQEALNNAGIGIRYNSKQHEEETGIYHYEWVWNLIKEVG